MKNNISQIEFNELLSKFLCNEMDSNETAEFQEVRKNFLSDEEMDVLAAEFDQVKNFGKHNKFSSVTGWQKLQSKMNSGKSVALKKSKMLNYKMLSRIAAILVLIVSVSAFLYLWNHNSLTNNENVLVINSSQNNLVKYLSDGTTIIVSNESSIEYPEDFSTKKSREVEMDGKVYFDVEKIDHKPFTVTTPLALIKVVGTAFTIDTYGEEKFTLKVISGTVEVSGKSKNSEKFLVHAGETLKFENEKLIKSSTNDISDWYKNNLRFKDVKVSTIVKVINNLYDEQFVIKDQKMANQILTVTFNQETPQEMVSLIKEAALQE